MKYLIITLSFLLVSISCSKDVYYKDLIKKEGLYYEKFTDVPFNGNVVGRKKGNILKGKIEGKWLIYNNSQLWIKSNYKNGKRHGEWIRYYASGKLHIKINYKEGKTEGEYLFYNQDGTLKKKGNFKFGKKNGKQFEYNKSGQLLKTEIFKDGKLTAIIEN